MKEIIRQKEVPASESEIKQAVDGWWKYLDRKTQVHPHRARGIMHGLIADGSEAAGVVRFSLEKNISPELSGLGKLVDAKIPHVYVEGAKNHNVAVPFSELYLSESLRPKIVFTADQKNKHPGYLQKRGIQPDRFLLYIYSVNDIEQIERVYQSIKVRELVFFSSKDGKLNALDLRAGLRGIYPPNKLRPLWFEKRKALDIKRATQSQIEIVQKSFRDAISQLSLIK